MRFPREGFSNSFCSSCPFSGPNRDLPDLPSRVPVIVHDFLVWMVFPKARIDVASQREAR